MAKPLRVLLIEDSEDDAELLLRELRRAGYEPTGRRVDTAAGLAAALEEEEAWDVVACDYVLPRFSALSALSLIRKGGYDVPVIIVSGHVGEDVAVSAMKAGAHDYVSKHRLVRLVPVVERAVAEARGRHRAARTLSESDDRYRELLESLHDLVFEIGPDERLTYMSPSVLTLSDAPPEEYVGRSFREFIYPDDLPALLDSLQRTLTGVREPLIYRVIDPRGGVHWVRSTARPVFDRQGGVRALRGVMTDVTDQVEAEQAYQTIFEHSMQALAVVQDDHIVLANPALVALTGYPLEELRATPLSALTASVVHPDDRERLAAAARAYAEGRGRTPGLELRVVRRDGTVRRVMTSHTDLTYRGRPARLVVYLDVTERWQAEEAYRTIFEGAIHGMVMIQGDRVVMANPAVEAIAGLSSGALAGRPLAEAIELVIHPDDRPLLRLQVERWIVTGQAPRRSSFRIRRDDGTDGLLYVQTAVVSHGGAPAALVAIADLTDRWRAEEAYRAVFERSQEGLLVISGAHVLMANQAAAALSGCAVDELTRLRAPELLERLVHPDDRPALQRDLDAYLASGDVQTRRYELRLRRGDGSERHVLSACSPMTFAGRPAILLGALDISDRWQAEEALRDLNAALAARVRERTAALQATAQELEAFTASAAHDLRAPLRVIDGFCQALVEDFGDALPRGALALLDRVGAASADMRRLLDQLLALSRAATGELRREPIDLSALAREVATELTRDEVEGRVAVTIEPGLRVSGDAALLRAALDNLLGNAVKFSRPRPRAEIAVGGLREGMALIYFVRDNGVGFDPAFADRLFRPFHRLHPASEFAGHGIGLATVERIINRHDGRIWAESAIDRGATFYFTLG